jgi:hypothetical protein
MRLLGVSRSARTLGVMISRFFTSPPLWAPIVSYLNAVIGFAPMPHDHIRLDPTGHTCPSCKVGTLSAYQPLKGAVSEMMKEIANPLMLFGGAWYQLYLNFIVEISSFYPQFQCTSCKANAVICPYCNKGWSIKGPLDHRERVTCPHCKKESYFSKG